VNAGTVAHHRRRFTGRDPGERERASTPLELLYDLTIVVAFGTAAGELAHYAADGHIGAGVGAFAISSFAVSWAWLNYTWFASAYDTDDWVFRVATMVQMAGVIVASLGLPPLFESIERGDTVDNRVLVAGYVVMRVALLALWWLVSRHDPQRRPAARAYIATVGCSQVAWVAFAALQLPQATALVAFVALVGVEVGSPMVAERRANTPWHPRHIAERYGLLVIITLGEVILGTVASVNAVIHGPTGWSLDAGVLLLAGVGLTFSLWWMYFAVPWAEPIVRHRDRGFWFGYGHLVLFAALAGMGGGLHVAAYVLDGEAEIGATATVLCVAVPVAVFTGVFYALYSILLRTADAFHILLLAATAAVLAAAVGLAAAGVDISVCLLVVLLAPITTIAGYETIGHRHTAAALERL
jgi:low temperature requirement protein LtrA